MKFFDAEHYIGSTSEISVERRINRESFDVHWHDFFEIEVILGGKGSQNLNGTEYQLEKGYAYLLTPTDYHDVTPDKELDIFNIMFHETMLSDEFLYMLSTNKSNLIFKFTGEEFKKINALCEVLEKEYKAEGDFKENYIKSIMECLMIHIFRKTEFQSKTPKKEAGHMQKAIRYIHLHFKDNPSLKDVAKIAGTNANYFSTKFKEETGVGYNEYLTQRKLKYAKQLLKSSSLSATEICYASGFNSLSNFMRVFKEKTAMSPVQYAKLHINKD
jgi:AraC-like DNA-binding protein